MRAVVCRELGPPEALVVEELPAPEPGPGEVRVAVAAAGVNHVDGLLCAGRYQLRVEPPFVPGSELAGVVEALGPGVEGLEVGDRVQGIVGRGAFAEQVVVRADRLARVPEVLDLPRAATYHQSYGTAWFALTRRTTVRPGEWALVLGAGGGTGLAAVDVARHLGARVVAVASSEAKRALALAAGAEAVLDPAADDVKARARELSGGGVDLVYDPVGGDLSEAAFRALGYDGRLLVIGFTAGIPRLPLNLALLLNRRVVGADWGGWSARDQTENAVLRGELAARVAAGDLRPVAPERRPLAEAGSALADLLARRVAGKLVLEP